MASSGSTLEVGDSELAKVSLDLGKSHRNDTCEFSFIATNRLTSDEHIFEYK